MSGQMTNATVLTVLIIFAAFFVPSEGAPRKLSFTEDNEALAQMLQLFSGEHKNCALSFIQKCYKPTLQDYCDSFDSQYDCVVAEVRNGKTCSKVANGASMIENFKETIKFSLGCTKNAPVI